MSRDPQFHRTQVVYSAPGMEHIDRREIERLATAVDRELNSDRRFFERRPYRNYRLRQAFPNERKAAELAGTCRFEPGLQAYVCVRQVEPGQRIRLFCLNVPGRETDLNEVEAKSTYDQLISSSQKVQQIEATLSKILGGLA